MIEKDTLTLICENLSLAKKFSSSLNTEFMGKNLLAFPQVNSTNNLALLLIESSLPPPGTVIIADYQTSGRGQKGNRWYAPYGCCLLFSIILFSPFNLRPITPLLSIITGLSLVETLKIHKITSNIKWPNDIYYKGKKTGGILIESKSRADFYQKLVVGIGINIKPIMWEEKELSHKATTLGLIEKNVREEVLKNFLYVFERNYKLFLQKNFATFKEQWKKSSLTFNKEVEILLPGSSIKGIEKGLNNKLHLVVEEKLTGKNHHINNGKLIYPFDNK